MNMFIIDKMLGSNIISSEIIKTNLSIEEIRNDFLNDEDDFYSYSVNFYEN